MQNKSAQARRQKRDPRTKQFVDEHKPRASTAAVPNVDLSGTTQENNSHSSKSSKTSMSTGGVKFALWQNQDGLWDSDYYSDAAKTKRMLNQMRDNKLGVVRVGRPNEDPEIRIETLLWGLNTGLIDSLNTRNAHRALSRHRVVGLGELRSGAVNYCAADMLLWYLWARPRDDFKPSILGVSVERAYDGFSRNRIGYLSYLFKQSPTIEMDSIHAKPYLSSENYREILATLADATNHTSRSKSNASPLASPHRPVWNGCWDYQLALSYYEQSCLAGCGDVTLPELARVFDSRDPSKNPVDSYLIDDMLIDNSPNVLNLWKDLQWGAYIRSRTTKAIPPIVSAAPLLMNRSLILAACSGNDPLRPLPPESDSLFPTPADILMAANPKEPGFWRLLIGLRQAMVISKVAASGARTDPRMITASEERLQILLNIADTVSEERLQTFLDTLDISTPSDDELLAQLQSKEALLKQGILDPSIKVPHEYSEDR